MPSTRTPPAPTSPESSRAEPGRGRPWSNSDNERLEYDRFADIYRVWTDTAASTQANLAFYVDAYLAADGPVVELGVGDGRIAVEAAVRGRDVIGVDLSPAMLDLCRERADAAGVLDRLTLMQARLPQLRARRTGRAHRPAVPQPRPPARRSTRSARRSRHIYSQLRPGGRFIFDDFLMTPTLARPHAAGAAARRVPVGGRRATRCCG